MTHDDVDPSRDARNDLRPDDDYIQAVDATITHDDWFDAAELIAEAEGISFGQFTARGDAGGATEAEKDVLYLLAFRAAERRWLLAQGATDATLPSRLRQRSHAERVAQAHELLVRLEREAEAGASAEHAEAEREAQTAQLRAQGITVRDLRDEVTAADWQFATTILAQALGVTASELTADTLTPYQASLLGDLAQRRLIREVCVAQNIPSKGVAAIEDAKLVPATRYLLAHPELQQRTTNILLQRPAEGANTDHNEA